MLITVHYCPWLSTYFPLLSMSFGPGSTTSLNCKTCTQCNSSLKEYHLRSLLAIIGVDWMDGIGSVASDPAGWGERYRSPRLFYWTATGKQQSVPSELMVDPYETRWKLFPFYFHPQYLGRQPLSLHSITFLQTHHSQVSRCRPTNRRLDRST